MACGCSENNLLGSLTLAPIKQGGRFQFGYNTGYDTGPFTAADVAQLTNAQGITQGAVSYVLSGTLSYYVAVEGKAAHDYGSASDLRDAIYNAIVGGGFSIDPASINFNFEPAPGSGTTPQVIYTGPGAGGGAAPTVPGASIFDDLAATLGVTRNTAQAVIIGGAVLALVLVMKK